MTFRRYGSGNYKRPSWYDKTGKVSYQEQQLRRYREQKKQESFNRRDARKSGKRMKRGGGGFFGILTEVNLINWAIGIFIILNLPGLKRISNKILDFVLRIFSGVLGGKTEHYTLMDRIKKNTKDGKCGNISLDQIDAFADEIYDDVDKWYNRLSGNDIDRWENVIMTWNNPYCVDELYRQFGMRNIKWIGVPYDLVDLGTFIKSTKAYEHDKKKQRLDRIFDGFEWKLSSN